MSRIAHIRIYPSDWRSGCLGLSLEQEGLYIRMCMFIAETNRRVPLDDTEAARMLNVQTRNYRRVLGELLRLGKVQRHDNGYGNDRVEHERNEAEKALDRKPSSSTAGGSERQADQGQVREDRRSNFSTSTVERTYNADITPLASEIRQQNQCSPIEPESEPVKENKHINLPSSQAAAREAEALEGRQELKSVLNGATDGMIADVRAWMGPTATDAHASKWLTSTIAAYGHERTVRAHSIIVAKLGGGEIVSTPLALWSRTAQGLRADPPRHADAPKMLNATQAALARRLASQAAKSLTSQNKG